MIISNIKLLEDTCACLQDYGLVRSKADFSERFLNKGSSYLTSMAAKRRNPPDKVVALLDHNLRLRWISCRSNPYMANAEAGGLQLYARVMHTLWKSVREHRVAKRKWLKKGADNDNGISPRPVEPPMLLADDPEQTGKEPLILQGVFHVR